MPVYDYQADPCGCREIDVYEPVAAPTRSCSHGNPLKRTWFTTPPAVIGDECDVWIKHGLCEESGAPRHFTSKADIARAAKEKGLINKVQHIGRPGGDKSPHTTKWV